VVVALAAAIILALRGGTPGVPAAKLEPPRIAKAAEPVAAPKAERPAPQTEPPRAAKPPPVERRAGAPAPKAAPERTAAATPTPAATRAQKAEPPPKEEPPTGFWRDQGITTKVAGKLHFNRRLWRTGIQVETKEGVVTLRGNVPSQDLIDEAVRITREVYGVRAVRNELRIGQPDLSSSSPGSGG
jgi:hyperosmotically inducible protein